MIEALFVLCFAVAVLWVGVVIVAVPLLLVIGLVCALVALRKALK